MLRNVSLLACIVVAAIGLAKAAEPRSAASDWVPAGRPRNLASRPASGETVALEAAQTGAPSLADRLKAVRSGATDDSGSDTVRDAAEPGELPADTTGEQLPSVLVRRGNALPTVTAEPALNPVDSTNTAEKSALAPSDAPTDTARRSARRPRSESPLPRSPLTPSSSPSPGAIGPSRSADANSLSLKSQGPTITVETEGPRSIAMGKPANYRLRLLNQGSSDAEHVIVTVTVPAWAQVTASETRVGSVSADNDADEGRRIVWDVERVASRSQQELSLSLQPTENRPIDLAVDWVLRGTPLQASIEVQQPQLDIAVEGPAEMRYGSTASFKIKLTNPGNGPAENVTVTVGATGIGNQPNAVGTLGAGESRSLEVELTAKQAGTMKIEAAAHGDGNLQAATTHEVHVRRPQLAVKVAAPSMLYAGATATYEIRVANTGDATAEGVTLELQLPAGHKNAVGVDKKPVENGSPRWRLGDLPPGTDRVYTMQCDLATGGQNQFAARVQGTDESQASASAVTTVEALADLKLVVNDPKGPSPVGKEVVYEIQILNRGSKEATNITLVAQFSEGIEPTSASGHASDIVPGQVIFHPITSLPAGGQVTMKVVATAQKAGNLRFRAELTCGEPETKLVSEETTRFYGTASDHRSSEAADRSSGEQPTPARR
jgi:uncharacterized repeat protein (TIGR01451 family)